MRTHRPHLSRDGAGARRVVCVALFAAFAALSLGAQTPTLTPTPSPTSSPAPITPQTPTPAPIVPTTTPEASTQVPVASASSADGLSFEQVFEHAARDNMHIRAVRARRAAAEANVSIAGERLNPEFNAAYTRSQPHMAFTVTQPLEIGGQRARRIEVAKNELRLTDFDVDAALRDLRRDLRVAYFNLALSRNTRSLAQQVVDQANRLVGIAEARFEAGDIAQFEVLQARLAAARASVDLSRAENTERAALAAINQLLNRAPQAPLDLSVSLFVPRQPVNSAQLISQSLSQNVELRTAEQQIAAEQSRLRLARANRIPTPSIGPGIEAFDPSLPHNYAFTMQVTVPLPIFNRGRPEIARSNALIDQLTAERDDARQRISAGVGQASLRLEAARQQVDFYETRLLPDAERVRAMAEEAYRAGQTGLLPVIDAQRNALEIRQGYLQALFDYQTALADLEQTAGVPLR